MAVASIPVDLFNPGQVFACLGFFEAADALLGHAKGGFDWSDEADVRFVLCASGIDSPFDAVLRFLADASLVSLGPAGSPNDTARWNIQTKRVSANEPFPIADPPSPATLPAVLESPALDADHGTARLVIDYWGDSTQRDTVKFWGGSAGYPGAALVRDALDLVRENCREALSDPFNLSAAQSSSLRFDWRRDYIPIDAGFSVNAHPKSRIVTVGFPIVEVLAAVGLGNARPKRLSHLEYRYSVMSGVDTVPLPAPLLRAALGDSQLPFPKRTFRMRLDWPGKEGQARSITTVTEETSA